MESIIRYPKITLSNENKYFITFYFNRKRYRVFNGSSMGIYLYPNSFSDPERYKVAQALAAEIYIAIQKGKAPTKSKNVLEATNIQLLKKGLESKLSQPFSKHHKTMLNYAFRALVRNTDGHNITNESVLSTLNHFDRGTSYNIEGICLA